MAFATVHSSRIDGARQLTVKIENLPYVVVVEDEPDDSFWLNREFKKSGSTMPIKLFSNGQEACDFFAGCDFLPSALFLDLHLPGMSGVELLKRLKASGTLTQVSVFILDGSSRPDEIAECENLGVNGFLEKPVTVKALTAIAASSIGLPTLPKSFGA